MLLAAFWLLLSGHYTPLLLALGVLSVALVLYLMHRAEAADVSPVPVAAGWGIFGYWAWLITEIVKSNIDVARLILDPKLPVEPVLLTVRVGQSSDFGRVMHGNSITLTPGTVTMDIQGDVFTIHALTKAGAMAVLSGEMDRRVSQLERQAPRSAPRRARSTTDTEPEAG